MSDAPENLKELLVLSKVREVTATDLYDKADRFPDDSKAGGGSFFRGVRLLKRGEYGGKRTWEALIDGSHLAFVGTTEKVAGSKGKWKGVSFSGTEYEGPSRNVLCEQMVDEFLGALRQSKG